MNDYQTFKIDPSFCVKVTEPRGFELSDVEKDEIESIWIHELREKGHYLVNGQILNIIQSEGQQWQGEFVDYKFYLAQLRNPYFREVLQIRPMGISGMTWSGDKVLIGQRSEIVATYPHYYETVPSGGVDPGARVGDQIDFTSQFVLELFEETGISSTEIKRVECFAVVYDKVNALYQMCGDIQVNYSIIKNPLEPSWEYKSLQWKPKSDLKAFLAKHQEEIVPLSRYMLAAKRLLA